MANFGELVLVLGDLHIPHRASKIPAPFKRMLVPNKMQHVVCTGNLSAEDYAELQSLAPNVHVVAGDYDHYPNTHMSSTSSSSSSMAAEGNTASTTSLFPESRVLQVGAFRMGVIHGHQIIPWNSREAIERMRRKMNVDILVTGHSHRNEVSALQNDLHYHINPVRLRSILLYRFCFVCVCVSMCHAVCGRLLCVFMCCDWRDLVLVL